MVSLFFSRSRTSSRTQSRVPKSLYSIVALAFTFFLLYREQFHFSRVTNGHHAVVLFSNRGLSVGVVELLRRYGFFVIERRSRLRPPNLDARWEKVFQLKSVLESSQYFSSVMWLDDDYLPDMEWLSRIVNSKDKFSLFAGYEYGRRKNRIMSNALVFRPGPRTTEIIREWTLQHMMYINKSTVV